MAQSRTGAGMRQFVTRNEPDAAQNHNRPKSQATQDLKSLKVPVPGQGPATSRGQATEPLMGRVTRSQTNGPVQKPRPFYETDTSSIDKTSTEENIKSNYPTNAPKHHDPSQTFRRNQQATHNEDDGFEHPIRFEANRDRLPNSSAQPEYHDQARKGQVKVAEPVRRSNSQQPDGRNLPHLSGDTYPDTTSGRASQQDADENFQANVPVHLQPQFIGTFPGALQVRGSGTRVSRGGQPPVPLFRGSEGHLPAQYPTAPPDQPLPIQPQSRDADGTMAAAASHFEYGAVRFPKPNTSWPSHPQPAPPNPLPVTRIAPADTLQNASTLDPVLVPQLEKRSKIHESKVYHAMPEPQRTGQAQREKSRRQNGHGTSDEQHQPSPRLPQQNMEPQFWPDEQPATNNRPQERRHSTRSSLGGASRIEQFPYRRRSAESHIDLDYNQPELLKMPFEDLQRQPFDRDPSAKDYHHFPSEHDDETLQQQLQKSMALPREDQAAFLASLDIDLWEEAGDWFLDRFSELAQKFKAARREKRKVSREFEGELAKHNDAVAKRRKLTEGALNEMKENGGRVLQGTPKRDAE